MALRSRFHRTSSAAWRRFCPIQDADGSVTGFNETPGNSKCTTCGAISLDRLIRGREYTIPAAGGAEADVDRFYGQDDPGKIDNSTMEITPTDKLHLTGTPQDIDAATYRLKIEGLVSKPLSLSYEDILKYPVHTETVLLICPMVFWDNATWSGVSLKALLTEAGVSPDATKVTFISHDGYANDLPISAALKEGVFLAHTVNSQVLPKEHGFPLRLVVKGEYGSKWVKWVDRITVS